MEHSRGCGGSVEHPGAMGTSAALVPKATRAHHEPPCHREAAPALPLEKLQTHRPLLQCRPWAPPGAEQTRCPPAAPDTGLGAV